MAMNEVRLLLQNQRDISSINLEFKQISLIEPLLPLLAKFEQLEALNLNGNRIKSLPTDMSCLRSLAELDISNNLLTDPIESAAALKSLPKLSHLLISLRNSEDEDKIIKALPQLQRLNKHPVRAPALQAFSSNTQPSAATLKESDLEAIGGIYESIRHLYRKSKYAIDQELYERFDRSVSGILATQNQQIARSKTHFEKVGAAISAKYSLADVCFVQLISYFHHFDKTVGTVLEGIHDVLADCFRQFDENIREERQQNAKDISVATGRREEVFKAQVRRLNVQREQQQEELSRLMTNNNDLIDKLVKYSRQLTISSFIGKRSGSANAARSPNTKKKLKDEQFQPLQRLPQLSKETISAISLRQADKSLTLSQLKDVMSEIMLSKGRHNTAACDLKQPFQTLESHMYTFLNQKYGLKSITLEWAISIVNAIRRYAADDPEVSAFGKAMRNEIEEGLLQSVRKFKLQFRSQASKLSISNDQSISNYQLEQVLNFQRDILPHAILKLKDFSYADKTLIKMESILVDHLVKQHQLKQYGLLKAFRGVDTDQDGVIDREGAGEVARRLGIEENLVADVPNWVDPNHTNVVTYSLLCERLQDHDTFKEYI